MIAYSATQIAGTKIKPPSQRYSGRVLPALMKTSCAIKAIGSINATGLSAAANATRGHDEYRANRYTQHDPNEYAKLNKR